MLKIILKSLIYTSLSLYFIFHSGKMLANEFISSEEFPAGKFEVISNSTDKREFPLKNTDVNINVNSYISEVEVTQTFINIYPETLEALYTFPLPNNAAVYYMEMSIGEIKIVSEIKTKEEAQQMYDQAKDEGRVPTLLEQAKSNIFSQSISNIAPNQEIKVLIKYTEELKFDKNKYELAFPMVVGPRYIPSNWLEENGINDQNKLNSLNPPYLSNGERSGNDISIDINLNTAGLKITNLLSRSHDIQINKASDYNLKINLSPLDNIPNKDLMIEYQLESYQNQMALFTHRPDPNQDWYFHLLVQPKTQFRDNQITPKEVSF